MESQRDRRVEARALLRAGLSISDISRTLNMSRVTVYSVKSRMEAGESLDHKPGAGKPPLVSPKIVTEAVKANTTKSMRKHGLDLGISPTTVSKIIKNGGGKSLVLSQKPLMT